MNRYSVDKLKSYISDLNPESVIVILRENLNQILIQIPSETQEITYFKNILVNLESLFKALHRRRLSGTLEWSDIMLEQSKLNDQLLGTIDDISKKYPDFNIDFELSSEKEPQEVISADRNLETNGFDEKYNEPFSSEAYRNVTETCLIAADIDKTILDQGRENEETKFRRDLAPYLIQAAELHTNLAFITGNSMDQLCKRFFKWFLAEIIKRKISLRILRRIYFFCNSGGVFIRFKDDFLDEFIAQNKTASADELFSRLTCKKEDPYTKKIKTYFIPQLIDSEYISKTRIPSDDLKRIQKILNQEVDRFSESKTKNSYKEEIKEYDLTDFDTHDTYVDARYVIHGVDGKQDSVQITIRPILSYKYAKNESINPFNDIRSDLVNGLRKRFDMQGLFNYDVKIGGRSSIDITLDKLDKAYALEYLIDILNLQGAKSLNEGVGAHTIYLGDEVIVGGGNDYHVTRIKGLLVFAVNENKDYVPLHSEVMVPYPNLNGPEVVQKVLETYNGGAKFLLAQFSRRKGNKKIRSAIDFLKKNYFLSRIKSKIEKLNLNNISSSEVQVLHGIVTLMCREDQNSRRWVSIFFEQLDSIMELLDQAKDFKALGTSYDDN